MFTSKAVNIPERLGCGSRLDLWLGLSRGRAGGKGATWDAEAQESGTGRGQVSIGNERQLKSPRKVPDSESGWGRGRSYSGIKSHSQGEQSPVLETWRKEEPFPGAGSNRDTALPESTTDRPRNQREPGSFRDGSSLRIWGLPLPATTHRH